MQVKKFEAKTMNEALQMVKRELGPEAIILSAKDLTKGFGILSQTSVEVTAAITENTWHKKKLAESKMREETKQKFRQSPAPVQRAMIDHVVDNHLVQSAAPRVKNIKTPMTSERYISIEDESLRMPEMNRTQEQAYIRIRNLAKNAREAGKEMVESPQSTMRSSSRGRPQISAGVPKVLVTQKSAQVEMGRNELVELKKEISRLQSLLQENRPVPKEGTSSAYLGYPGAAYGIPYDFNFMFEKLTHAGVDAEVTAELLKDCRETLGDIQAKKKPLIDAHMAKAILDKTLVTEVTFPKGTHLFLGPSGSGKTSTLIKAASHLIMKKGGSVAILTTDTQKLGAIEQMRIFCKILNVPFATVKSREDWTYLLNELKGIDYILCDYPGLQLKELTEIDTLRALLPHESELIHRHLVLSATTKDQDIYQFIQKYRQSKFHDLVFTNLDQSSQHGILFNVTQKFGFPLHSFGIGSRIPEDYEVATKERVLDLIFKLSKLK